MLSKIRKIMTFHFLKYCLKLQESYLRKGFPQFLLLPLTAWPGDWGPRPPEFKAQLCHWELCGDHRDGVWGSVLLLWGLNEVLTTVRGAVQMFTIIITASVSKLLFAKLVEQSFLLCYIFFFLNFIKCSCYKSKDYETRITCILNCTYFTVNLGKVF